MARAEREANEKRAKELLNRPWKMLIGGELVDAIGGETYDTFNPATGERLAKAPFAQERDVNRAVQEAEAAFPAWRKTPVTERVALVRKMISVLKEKASDLALMDSVNSGNPIANMIPDVHLACNMLEYLCGAAMEVKGQTIPSTSANWHMTIREPYGVVGRIIPFNHPIMFSASKIGAPLLTGNTLVLKVPDQAPLAGLLLGELIRDIFPKGVVNIISGDGATTGNALVRHPNVKRISLIGSYETGKRIQMSAAEVAIKHVSLELGGKNPMIVFPDADLDKAVRGAVAGMNFMWQGQSCGSTSRLFLHEDIYDEFVARLKASVEQIRVGNPLDPDTQMGAIISERQYEKVMHYIRLGKEQGAVCLTGGERPQGEEFAKGYFVLPTVFTEVIPDMAIFQDEIFGPVMSVIRWKDEEEMIAQANSTLYGLTGAVWTRDIHTAFRVIERLQSGFTWINGTSRHFIGVPFSGQKNSGIDSEEGIEELYSFTQIKSVNIILE